VTGPTGPTGVTGVTGATGTAEDCCCKESVRYAIQTIIAADPTQNISLVSFNTTQTGVVSGFQPSGDVVNIIDAITGNTVFVSLCNVVFITFPNEPITTPPSPYNCTSPDCCCNTDLEAAIRSIIGPTTFPAAVELNFDVINNTAANYRTATVYGICNGILWVEFVGVVEGNSFGAIPLCSIFNVSDGPLIIPG